MSASQSYPVDPEARIANAGPTEGAVWSALRTVEDPELPVSVVDLGLVYDVAVDGDRVAVDLTLTYSGCPAKEMILRDVEAAVAAVQGIDEVSVSVVHSPPWSYERITDRGRADLREHGIAVPDASRDLDADCH